MSKRVDYINITLRTVIFIFIPSIALVSLVYQSVFGSSIRLQWFSALMYLVFIVDWMTERYTRQWRFLYVTKQELDHTLLMNNWEIVDRDRKALIVRPAFDRPFNYILNSKVDIQFLDQKVGIEGPAYYINALAESVNKDHTYETKQLGKNLKYVIAALLIPIPFIQESGIIWEAKVLYHNVQANTDDPVIEPIDVERGNSAENSNNGGYGVTDDDYLYLIDEQDNLVRINKTTEEKDYILKSERTYWLGDINLVDDWLYYTDFESLKRIKTDGTEREIVYDLGYLYDVHIVDGWVYFINAEDSDNPYRMNLEGGEVKRLLDVNATDISVYEDKLLVSHGEDSEAIFEQTDLNGSNRKTILEGPASHMLQVEDYYYYIGNNDNLYRKIVEDASEPELLIQERIRTFTMTDQGIVYVKEHYADPYESNGIYQSEMDGTDKQLIENTKHTDSLIKIDDYILYNMMQGSDYESLERVEFSK